MWKRKILLLCLMLLLTGCNKGAGDHAQGREGVYYPEISEETIGGYIMKYPCLFLRQSVRWLFSDSSMILLCIRAGNCLRSVCTWERRSKIYREYLFRKNRCVEMQKYHELFTGNKKIGLAFVCSIVYDNDVAEKIVGGAIALQKGEFVCRLCL